MFQTYAIKKFKSQIFLFVRMFMARMSATIINKIYYFQKAVHDIDDSPKLNVLRHFKRKSLFNTIKGFFKIYESNIATRVKFFSYIFNVKYCLNSLTYKTTFYVTYLISINYISYYFLQLFSQSLYWQAPKGIQVHSCGGP